MSRRPTWDLALGLGAILDSEITNKNVQNVALNRPQKGPLFAVGELKQEDRAPPCSVSAGDGHLARLRFFAGLHASVKGPQRCLKHRFGGYKEIVARR